MLKEERFKVILQLLETQDIVKVSELSTEFNVSEMTIRRDLLELEENGKLIRIHGGAKKDHSIKTELSHKMKQDIKLEEKHLIAKKIADTIDSGDVIFLGAGTTIELVAQYLSVDRAKIITNSLPLFHKLKVDERLDVILIGGIYRSYTGCFVGNFANKTISNIFVDKAYIGVNGICQENIFTYNEEEGMTQSLVLDNASKKFIVADSSKIERKDFYAFYSLDECDYLIVDNQLPSDIEEKYAKIIEIL